MPFSGLNSSDNIGMTNSCHSLSRLASAGVWAWLSQSVVAQAAAPAAMQTAV
jgi:hypothetical protein